MGRRKKKPDLTNQIFSRLAKRVEAALLNEDVASLNLPEKVEFQGDLEVAFKYWDWLEATEWKWDINTLAAQPEVLMNDVATLASLYNTMYRIAKKDAEKRKGT